MDAYGYLAFFLILFVFFIYIVWFGYSVKVENQKEQGDKVTINPYCLLYTSPSPRDLSTSRMPSSA